MTSPQILNILISITFLSSFFVLNHWLQEKFGIRHRTRLLFLKANLVLILSVFVLSSVVMMLHAGRAIGTLLPANEVFDRAISVSRSRVLLFENDGLWLSHLVLGIYLLGLSVGVVHLTYAYLRMRRLLLNSSGFLDEIRTLVLQRHAA